MRLFDTVLSGVADTGIATLFCRYFATQWGLSHVEDPVMREMAETVLAELRGNAVLDYDIIRPDRINPLDVLRISCRSRLLDTLVLEIAGRLCDEGPLVVVNIGCGFDTRFHRLALPSATFLDVDLDEVISLKRTLLSEATGYRMIAAADATAEAWLASLKAAFPGRYVFVCEGLFCYLSAARVTRFLGVLDRYFAGGYLVCDSTLSGYHSPVRPAEMASRRRPGTRQSRDPATPDGNPSRPSCRGSGRLRHHLELVQGRRIGAWLDAGGVVGRCDALGYAFRLTGRAGATQSRRDSRRDAAGVAAGG